MPEPKIAEVRTATQAQWQEMAAACPTSTFFHTVAWTQLWSQYAGRGLEPHPWLVRFDDGVEALLPAVRHRSLGGLMTRYASSAGAEYGDWLCKTRLSAQHQSGLAGMLSPYPITLRQNPFEDRHEPFHVDWTRQDFTQYLELSGDIETMVKSWSDSHRRSLRKAEGGGMTCILAGTRAEWGDYYRLYESSLNRWGVRAQTIHRRGLFELVQQLPAENVRLWLVRRDGHLAAGALCFYFGRHAVYWHGASDSSHFEARPVHFLFYHAIRDALQRGYRWFDFGPSGGLPGVIRFKDGFGCSRRSANVRRQRTGWLSLIDTISRRIRA
jgi:CelD/BcsL family acetyltransferase involved in cellulose biosynthesis